MQYLAGSERYFGCGETRSEEETIVETSGGSTIEYRSKVCAEGECSTNAGNLWRYLDGTHMSVGISETLARQVFTFWE